MVVFGVDLALDIQTAQNVPLALEPASIGERIVATVVDVLIVGAWIVIVNVAVFSWLPSSWGTVTALILLPIGLYHLLFEVFLEGRTPGKLAMKTQVARLDGAQPTLSQYALRWLIRFVDVTVTAGAAALVSVLLSKNSQRLGDLAAGTTVVRRRRRVRLAEVLYPELEDGHVPTFLEADALSDADIRTLRAVIVRLRMSSRGGASVRLARSAKAAVEKRLGLEPVRMAPEAFLRAVVRDHVFLMDQLSGSIAEPPTSRVVRPATPTHPAPE
ncbi:RDD family protein [Rubrivirga sp.]|uniref:RDD family protein n=1 Tax=Rubrivirga sp. TaxID=1885344 RepID=UPI003C77AB57